MKLILFGATGMVGQGALLEALDDPRVERVLAVVRKNTGRTHPKLAELVHKDFADYSAIEAQLQGYDACLFCLGVSAAGMSEADYRRITVDFTLSAAAVLLRLNPRMAFVYVSGDGTDSTGKSRMMWARVKGETENALLALPFGAAYMFRPGYIQPKRGVVSSTSWYRYIYATVGLGYPLWKAMAPSLVTDSVTVGRAMLRVISERGPSGVLGNKEINQLGA